MSDIQPGLYKHYKGHTYRVEGVAKHSETLEEMVIYTDQNPPHQTWVRPIAMFDEIVESEEYDYTGPRFIRIEDQ